jgi:hypothetical protein
MPQPLPHVTIVLCTRNGGAHLAQQLQSYLAQDHRDWSLWVSDDGSDDETPALIAAFAAAQRGLHPVRVVQGPRRGAAANFLALLCHPDLPPGPVALSDQDDVWQPDRLSRALAAVADPDLLTLYGAQSLYVRPDLGVTARSRLPPRPAAFTNALTQNVVSGHTAALSAAALALVRAAGPVAVPYHDWWLYQLVSGAGGRVVLDDQATVLYRQHSTNAMGAHHGLGARLGRAQQVLARTYGGWIAANLGALAASGALLTDENRAIVDRLRAGPASGRARVALLRDLRLHRQGRLGNLALGLAALLGRV